LFFSRKKLHKWPFAAELSTITGEFALRNYRRAIRCFFCRTIEKVKRICYNIKKSIFKKREKDL